MVTIRGETLDLVSVATMSEDRNDNIPSWDGQPSTWLLYCEDVQWFVSGLAKDRSTAVGKLVSRLGAASKALVRK